MTFNSIEYFVFLPVVFLCYWLVFKGRKSQNLFILCASYFFYGWWDWRFLALIFITSLSSFMCGYAIERSRENGKHQSRHDTAWWLSLGNILVNFGILGAFKYFNFFASSVAELLSALGFQADPISVNLILPVGISFYTFQAVGYTIDVYKGRVEATRDPVQFFSFLSFFPQLVAGPVESARDMLPQFGKDRRFDSKTASDGMRQILWGFFKKCVVADNCALVVNMTFADCQHYTCTSLIYAVILFLFQLYGDFSGYSDIAAGSAKLFGFKLTRNFDVPFFSRDMAEFWRRWHISLMRWFKDYLYIPLGGGRCTKAKHLRNILIVFAVSGLWHGAEWTYIIWGIYNGLLVCSCVLLDIRHTGIAGQGRLLPSIKELAMIALTFFLTVVGCLAFRSETVPDLCNYVSCMFTHRDFCIGNIGTYPKIPFFILGMILLEWFNRNGGHALELPEKLMSKKLFPLRFVFYVSFFILILVEHGLFDGFIYFQF